MLILTVHMTFLKSQMKQVLFKSAGVFGLCGVMQTPRCFTLAKFSTLKKKKKKSALRKGHDLFKPPGAAGSASKYTTYCERWGWFAGILVTYIILVYLWFMETETTSFFPMEYWLGCLNHQHSECFYLNIWKSCGPFFSHSFFFFFVGFLPSEVQSLQAFLIMRIK